MRTGLRRGACDVMSLPDDNMDLPEEGVDVDSGVFYGAGSSGAGRAPEQVGPYRIVRQLGQGGMGVVYLAEQVEPIRRLIALKLVKLGMDTEQVVSRFRAERQSMALMDHPGIARVFDAGATELGRPYFIMEYVEGTPITHFCDRECLDTRARLMLFVEVCHAVQHAHQKGVIHRDIKPSNVLVSERDGDRQPKIIDFGIAKATAENGSGTTLHTQAGQFVGTPEYMSPEQVSGAPGGLDTRTDVYSLGVLLYELLVGSRPLDLRSDAPDSVDDMRQRIREEEPVRPSTRVTGLGERSVRVARRRASEPEALRNLLKGDLDWIVMKAMEKDRNRRYASASEFAADVQRYLECEPVRAAPPSAHYRLRKFVRRNRGFVSAAGAAALALVLGSIVIFVMYLQAEDARADAQANADRLKLVNEFMLEMFNAADPSEEGRDVRVVDLLEGASDRIEHGFDGEPGLEAGVRYAVGATYRGLGLYDEALVHLERALELYEESLGPDDALTIDTMSLLATTRHELGDYDASLEMLNDALVRNDARFGETALSSLLLCRIGVNEISLGRYEEAEASLEQALAIANRTVGPDSIEVASALLNIGQLRWTQGQYEEAVEPHRRALEIRRDVLGARHPSTLNAMSNYGLLLLSSGRVAEAEPLLRELLALSREVRGETHQWTLLIFNNYAGALFRQNKFEEVEALLTEALPTLLDGLGEEHPLTLTVMNNLGVLLTKEGRLDEAEQRLRRAYAGRIKVLGDDHRDTGLTAASLGAVLVQQEQFDEALTCLERGVSILERVMGSEHERTQSAELDMVEALRGLGRRDEGDRLLNDVRSRLVESLSERSTALD